VKEEGLSLVTGRSGAREFLPLERDALFLRANLGFIRPLRKKP